MLSDDYYRGKVLKLVLISAAVITGLSAFLIFLIYGCRWDSGHSRSGVDSSMEYIEKNRSKALVEIPEMFELANIAIAISEEGLKHPNRVRKRGAYYEKVLEYFKPFKNHSLILEPSLHYNFTYQFRDNSICYVFDGDKIVHGGLYTNMREPDRFKKQLELVEDFAKVSSFRKFYRDNLPYYQEQIRLYRQKVPLRKMWTWLEERFPARHDCYKVVFSPLLGSSHETCSFEKNGFSETIMFVSGPGEPGEISDAVGQGLLARGVFTEIDHNYVNSVTNKNAGRVNDVFTDFKKWNGQEGYPSPEMTFNEYMTWAVFTLYAHDTYERQDFEIINSKMTRQMVNSRKFVLFEQFDKKLLEIYLARKEGQTIPQLYPAILDWAENYK
ncbi:MAG: DUF4932 domain-containing protein [Planctomycetota bacterium]|jgi:hypothetical protein